MIENCAIVMSAAAMRGSFFSWTLYPYEMRRMMAPTVLDPITIRR